MNNIFEISIYVLHFSVYFLLLGPSEITNWSVLVVPKEGCDEIEKKSLPEFLCSGSTVLYAKANSYGGQGRSYERMK